MRLSDILNNKGSTVVTMDPDCTALQAAQTLVDHNIGAVVVMGDGSPVGILSERDILRLTSHSPQKLDETLVSAIMTQEVVYASEADSLNEAMQSMTTNRIRHLPVLRGDELVGIVSIGDVVNTLRTEYEEENQHLKQYIAGAG